MKLFSWSNLFFVLSLTFLWGCGYWVWWQHSQNQQVRSQELLSIQLERAEVVLSDWQHSNQLHLEYLQNALQGISNSHDNPLYDPAQELDDRIQRTRWPDPLLGYALLDDAGRAVLLSNHSAGKLYPLTAVGASQQLPFLPPLVTSSQWIAPLQLALGSQYLVLWFDVSALRQRLLRLASGHGEVLLVNTAAELLSPSRYQSLLLQRFISTPGDEQLLRWALKRPPEDLSRSKQRYDSSTAWPATALAKALRQQQTGMTPLYVQNYLGKPSVAAWRWSAGWQAFIVAELDLTAQQQERLQLRQYLLLGLTSLSIVLLLVFWHLQRAAPLQVTEHPDERRAATGAVSTATAVAGAMAANHEPAEQPEARLAAAPPVPGAALQSAAGLLQAWLGGQLTSEMLRTVSRDWLQQHQFTLPGEPVLANPQLLLAQLLQREQAESAKSLQLAFGHDLAGWYWFNWPLLLTWLQAYSTQRLQAADVSDFRVRLLAAEPGLLRLELSDDGQALNQSQWQQQNVAAQCWQQLQQQGVTASQFSELFSGNKMVLTLPANAGPQTVEPTEVQFVDATALLLCQAGALQQQYCRQLRQAGLNLLPLDDASQFISWCAEHPQQQLDYMLLDDSAVRADPALVSQVATVVRRYFPAVTLLLLASEPARYLSLCDSVALRVVAKPALTPTLLQALQATAAAVFRAHPVELQLYCTQPMQVLLLQQQLQSLGYPSQLHTLESPDLSLTHCCLYPRQASSSGEPSPNIAPAGPVLWYQFSDEAATDDGATDEAPSADSTPDAALCWHSSAGLGALSLQLFLLLQKKSVE